MIPKTLSSIEREFVAEMYSSGIGTIHGFAAYYGVSIPHIKQTLNDYHIDHGQHTKRGRQYFSMRELVRHERLWKERKLEQKYLTRQEHELERKTS